MFEPIAHNFLILRPIDLPLYVNKMQIIDKWTEIRGVVDSSYHRDAAVVGVLKKIDLDTILAIKCRILRIRPPNTHFLYRTGKFLHLQVVLIICNHSHMRRLLILGFNNLLVLFFVVLGSGGVGSRDLFQSIVLFVMISILFLLVIVVAAFAFTYSL